MKVYPVRWKDDAVVTLEAIVDFLSVLDADAAHDIALRLLNAAETLDHFPARGRPGSGGTRELLSVRPYAIRYEIVGDYFDILRIRDLRQLPDD